MISGKELVDGLRGGGLLGVRSYSGRSMYGKECVAVTGDSELSVAADIAEAFEDSDVSAARLLRGATTDSMGLGVVVYWPRIEWPAGEKSDEDEDGDDE